MDGTVWYEVFISDDIEGTRTIESFDTLEEAESFRDDYKTTHEGVEVFIDSWSEEHVGPLPRYPGCSDALIKSVEDLLS